MAKRQNKGRSELLEALRSADAGGPPRDTGHGFGGPVPSKVKGGAHTKADLKRAGSPQGDRIGERSRGLS
ncbi:hypothetical protein [Streptomyces sp. NPDC101132]|uniref:hypothetical protein n=1 Tax=Streptomyces sp. NPDC101132 TaxID=3366110 RepID=UPI0037F36704